MSSHSLLRRTSRRSGSASRIFSACSWKVAALASISSLGEHRAQRRAPRRVADARGVVADDQHHAVAGVLELAQLAQHDRVAEVDVGRGRVDPELHAQLAALRARPRAACAPARPPAGCRRRCAASSAASRAGPRRPRRRRSAWGPMLDSRRLEGPTAPRQRGQRRRDRAPPATRRRASAAADERRRSPATSPPRPSTPPLAEPAPRSRRLKRLRFVAILFAVAAARPVSFVFGMFVSVASDLPSLTRFSQLQGRAELDPARRPRPPDRRAQPAEPRDRHRRTDPADRQGGGDLDRGQALLRPTAASTSAGIARAFVDGHRAQRHRPGRLDDRAAVHQERAAGPVAPHDLREAPRGGARLPALAQVVEGKDHHRLPQHDLLRQRRLRDRGGGADLLRPRSQPSRLRHARPRSCASHELKPWEAALLAGIIQSPTAYDPAEHPDRRHANAATSCCARCSNRAT